MKNFHNKGHDPKIRSIRRPITQIKNLIDYGKFELLDPKLHSNYTYVRNEGMPWLSNTNAVPVTVLEFDDTHIDMPIVFSASNEPIPLAIMGLDQKVNVFVGKGGETTRICYIPVYAQIHPFSFTGSNGYGRSCAIGFDPTSDCIGEFDHGEPLYDNGASTEFLKDAINFCELVAAALNRTEKFVEKLCKYNLLVDDVFTLHIDGEDRSFSYDGFKIVCPEKLHKLEGSALHELNKLGFLAPIYYHLASLRHVAGLFRCQVNATPGFLSKIRGENFQ